MPCVPNLLHDLAQFVQLALCILRAEDSYPISFEDPFSTFLYKAQRALNAAFKAP